MFGIIDYTSFPTIFSLICTTYLVIKRPPLNHKAIKLLFYFLIAAVIFDFFNGFLSNILQTTNIWVANILIFVELSLFSGILFCFIKSALLKRVVYGSLLFWLVVYTILHIIGLEVYAIDKYNYISRPIGFIILLILCIATFIHYRNDTMYDANMYVYPIWLIGGIVVYSIGHAFVFSGILVDLSPFFISFMFNLLLFTNIFSYILFAISVVVYYRETAPQTLD